MILTQEIAYKEITSFFGSNPTPLVVLGTGTSCALDVRFGMNVLKKELIDKVPALIKGRSSLEKEWRDVINALLDDEDLEHAMDKAKTEELVNIIVKIAGDLISSLDQEYYKKIYKGESIWPGAILFKRLVDRLPESDRALHVVTSNYDMLAEYAFEKNGIPYINGFWGNIFRKFNWEQSIQQIKLSKEIRLKGSKKTIIWNDLKHINLHKVHGSINTFWFNDEVVENNLWSWNPPENCERVLVTPGISKFAKLAHFRKELVQQFDRILDNKDSFLFIGYGFNDTHIECYIHRKLKSQKCPGLIITRDNNERIQKYLHDSDNLLLICMEENSGNSGTRIFNKQYDDWLYLYDKQLWNIQEFTKELIGD